MTARNALLFTALLSTALVFPACSSGGGDDDPLDFAVHTSAVSASAGTPVAIAGKNIAFLASEGTTGPGGTNFNAANGDTDATDAIAVVIDAATRVETVLNVAAAPPLLIPRPLAWIGEHLYIVVDEALDSKDWNGDTDTDDLVLLHWTVGMPTPEWIDDLVDPPSPQVRPIVAVGGNLFYSAAAPPVGPMASNLWMLTTSLPTTPVPVPTQDALPLSPNIIGEDEGLVFLTLDESLEMRDLNGDLDFATPDFYVLALLDGTIATPLLRSTGLAMNDAIDPVRAKKIGVSDWQVGFLVSEMAQGATNLNDPSLFDLLNWPPPQCTGADADTTDTILHFLEFKKWVDNPGTNPIRNTGIAGGDKIAIANGFVATIAPEEAQGPAGCDLNMSGSASDRVVRWTRIVAPPTAILPPNNLANLRALADIPGGTHGLAELDNRFVIVVSEDAENEDINGDAGLQTFDLVASGQPTVAAPNIAWDFTHGEDNNRYVGTSWVTEQRDRTRLNVAFEEQVPDAFPSTSENLNGPGTSDGPPPADDPDLLDSIPTFADFGSFLAFPGVKIAVDKEHSGILVAGQLGFYRVSEAEDSRDWNEDGDEVDFVVRATSLAQATSRAVSTVVDVDRPAVEVNQAEAPSTAVLLADESQITRALNVADLNDDGDALDIVIQYFRF